MDKSIGIIILAAGASTRLGQPKQLLIYQNHSLIFNTVKVAVNSGYAPIVVVLGAYADLIFPEVRNFPVKIVKNCDWQEGMNTSIKVGLNSLKATKNKLMATVLMLRGRRFEFHICKIELTMTCVCNGRHRKILNSIEKH